MKTIITYIALIFICASCAETTHQEKAPIEKSLVEKKISVASQIAQLKTDGYQIFDYVDEKTGDTVIMQQYFMAFLKSGPNRDQSKEEAAKLQEAHMAHLGRMYEEGYADISGPFGDDGDLRGITVYNVPTLKMADSLANLDPMMKSGRLMVEIKPWWAGKGYPLR
ncbi:YciI family protein [Dokdonia sp.]|uniref:YciI family protein n=1 Tax=Dokdonia sp. TaxID=2024995 RepID=UPI003266F8AE